MAEYIERKKLEEAFDNADPDVCESDLDGHSDWGFGRGNIRDVIRGVPTADVAPVARGEWVGTADGYADGELVYDMWTCSECGFDADEAEEKPKWRYCPNCGAKMDGGTE